MHDSESSTRPSSTPTDLATVQFHLPSGWEVSSYEAEPTPALWIPHTDDDRLITIGQDSQTTAGEYRVTYGVGGEDPAVNTVYESLSEAVFRAEALAWQHQ